MRKFPFFITLSLIVLILGALEPRPSRAQAGTAYDLIAAVNALRAANGLSELRADPILMSVVQAHTDYQASIGQVTHTGSGGTRPKDRAAAAGYGGGATFFISENIQGGTNLSPQTAVDAWTGDDLHWNTMMGANYQDIGAGVAEVGGFTYYTIDTAYVSGGSSQPPNASATPDPGTATPIGGMPGPSPLPIYAVLTVTPYPDGSVIHIVQSGHTLYTIAEAYGVSVDEILRLNNRKLNDRLYVGDKLIIRAAYTPTPTDNVTDTPTPRPPTATRWPTRTNTALPPTRTPLPTPTVTLTATPISPLGSDPVGNVMLGGVMLLLALGILLVAAGAVIKARS